MCGQVSGVHGGQNQDEEPPNEGEESTGGGYW